MHTEGPGDLVGVEGAGDPTPLNAACHAERLKPLQVVPDSAIGDTRKVGERASRERLLVTGKLREYALGRFAERTPEPKVRRSAAK